MKAAILAFALCQALPLTALAQGSVAPGAGASAPHAIGHKLEQTQAELQHQRIQSKQLRARVDDLERRSAANRAQQQQRDREIADLQRKLQALGPAPAATASTGGH